MKRESLQCLCFVTSTALLLSGIVGVFMLMDYLGDIGVPVGIIALILLIGGSSVLLLCMAGSRKKDRSFTQVLTPTEVAEPVLVPVTILQLSSKRGSVVEVV